MDELVANNQIFLFVVSIVGAVIWLRQGITKSSINEATNLATTRGEIIDDLHEDMDRRDQIWTEKCASLSDSMSELAGQMKLLRDFKTAEIIEGVQAGVAETVALELHKMRKA